MSALNKWKIDNVEDHYPEKIENAAKTAANFTTLNLTKN